MILVLRNCANFLHFKFWLLGLLHEHVIVGYLAVFLYLGAKTSYILRLIKLLGLIS